MPVRVKETKKWRGRRRIRWTRWRRWRERQQDKEGDTTKRLESLCSWQKFFCSACALEREEEDEEEEELDV